MIGNMRKVPERREMDLIGNVFMAHWGKITVIIFALGGIWATLQGQISSHKERLARIEKSTDDLHDFMVAQIEINKRIIVMDGKLDVLLLGRERGSK